MCDYRHLLTQNSALFHNMAGLEKDWILSKNDFKTVVNTYSIKLLR